jgi:EAL domain-containing protein (putative c-di-GMP-specific phosphodiesterase class I)
MAMYRAKRRGTEVGQPSTSDSQRAQAADLHLDAELHRAVDRGEFVVYYQPEIELASGRIVGAEALVRWQHPKHGLLQPGVFIGLAERTGLIVPIGRQVLEQACRQLHVWSRRDDAPSRVSVNLSPRQLRDPRLIHTVADAIGVSGIRPGQLTLEITETATISMASRRVRILEDLKMLGVSLALDDFGKGYSSLNRLRRLPVETLKVDRTFVRRIRRDVRDAAIVRAIIQMGHSFGLSIVAEGVTSTEEADFLLEQSCETAQGFLYSQPVATPEFERLLDGATWSRKAA